ncbi:MAG: hypothetical protein ACTHJ9_05300 [Rhodanobacter sp.]
MADLHETCEAAGLDSRKYRPIAHATPTGRVAVYIGAAWQELPRGKAANLRDQLTSALQQLAAHSLPVTPDEPPAPFAEQLARFQRQGLAAQAAVDRELAEARALAEINGEAQP